MPEATWQNERCYAMRLLGKTYDALGQDGREWYQKACKEAPNTREPWVELGKSCLDKSDWQGCYNAIKEALKVTNKEEVYTMNPEVWKALPHDLLALSAYNLGYKEESIEHGAIAVELEPDNTRLISNLEYYRVKHGTVIS